MNIEEEKKKQRIHRLALLRHAHKCQKGEGECCVSPNCAYMKELWKHMIDCRRFHDCDKPFCASSRFILIHYRDCQDGDCEVCVPVRTAIATDDAMGRLSQEEKELVQSLMSLQSA